MLQDVIEALRRKAPDALALARDEVAAAPESADAQHLLGVAQREAGDVAGARASFERAIELAPDESLYHFSRALLGWAERDLGAVDRASAHALALDPNQLGAYMLRIQLALAGGDTAEAERQYQLAERVDPENPQLLSIAGQIALAKGDLQVAIDRIRRASAIHPRDPQILSMLGMAYLRQGHPAFAEQVLRTAKRFDPQAADIRRLLVQSLFAQGRREDAAAELSEWQAAHPHDQVVALVAAELKLRMGDARGALDACRQLLAHRPDLAAAIMAAERALNAIGDRALARVVWDEIVTGYPAFDPAWASRISVSDDREDREDVLRRWRRALPDSAVALLNQARHDEMDGRAAEAEAGYDAVLAKAPAQADALFGKAMYEWRRDPVAAYARFTALISSAPVTRAKPVMMFRGRLLDGMDRVEEAVVDWLEAASGIGMGPLVVPLPEPALRKLPLPAADAAGADDPVVLIWGPPGSSSERLAGALLHAPSRPLMLGTRLLAPRVIELPSAFLARAIDAAELPTVAAEIAAEYARSVEPFQRAGNLGVFDWQARWDARIVPALRHALPRLRLVAPVRDPRDLLLNWLAFGAPAGPNFTDPGECARWLAQQLEHLLFSRDVLQLPVLVVDMDRFDADPATAMQQVADFAALPAVPDPTPALLRRVGPGGAPSLLPAGRWQAYRGLWPEAFGLLEPLAERLGYARD